jgi:methionine aminotransferase
MHIQSKLPNTGTTIFTVMSSLAQEHGAVNLSQGFPNFDPDPKLRRLVYEHMERGANQYSPMPGIPLLRERIAQKIAITYPGVTIDPNTEITVTAGGTQAIFCAIAAFVGPGDEVILIEPCYDSYRPSVETMGGIAIPYALSAPDYQIDWEAVQALITPRTKMICTNTPCNPTGTVLSVSDLDALAGILRDTNIILLSDEVYEHLIFDGHQHATVLAHPELRERSLAVYSFGKTFHNTGWKTGYIVAPEILTKEFRKIHQFNVFSANHPIQAALAEYLADPATYRGLEDFYQRKRDFFLELMQGSRFKPLQCTGTYFQLFDYSAVSDEPDLEFCKRLTKEFGVATIPVSSFFSSGKDEKVIRVCFAKTEDILTAAAIRLKEV